MNTKRIKTAAAAAALLGLLVAGAQASNVVGYIKTEVPAGISLMSVPFETVGGGLHTLDSVFGDKLADGSEVFLFIPGVGYTTFTYFDGFGWYEGENEAGTTQLTRGAGFWVRNNSVDAVALVLRGQVPVSNANVDLPTGVTLVSFGFPVEEGVNDAQGWAPLDGDEIFAFTNGAYVTHTYFDGFGWYEGENPSTLTFSPGQAYWYRRNGATVTWTQSLPESVDL